ncbi:hypothetical protein DA2_0739 [Desulfovibrio sp. A2]|nr:hypothetical protein DA2_0739 [Desulfovibrio sp. A2]
MTTNTTTQGQSDVSVTALPRMFKIVSQAITTTYSDPDPALTPEEVKAHFAGLHPELASGTVRGPEIDNDTMLYTIESGKAGVKG